jgi:protein-disulfide isomerase
MRQIARHLLVLGALLGAGACAPRPVVVGTAPAETQSGLHVTNQLNQAVNVYVRSDGTDMFLRQVPANTTLHVPISGIRPGATVTFRAVTVDGVRTFTRANVVLSGTYTFPVP